MIQATPKVYTCKHCNAESSTYSTYYSHVQKHKQPRIQCVKCPLKFHVNAQMYRHVFLAHTMESVTESPHKAAPIQITPKRQDNKLEVSQWL